MRQIHAGLRVLWNPDSDLRTEKRGLPEREETGSQSVSAFMQDDSRHPIKLRGLVRRVIVRERLRGPRSGHLPRNSVSPQIS